MNKNLSKFDYNTCIKFYFIIGDKPFLIVLLTCSLFTRLESKERVDTSIAVIITDKF